MEASAWKWYGIGGCDACGDGPAVVLFVNGKIAPTKAFCAECREMVEDCHTESKRWEISTEYEL